MSVTRLRWEQLVALEPRLADLEHEARDASCLGLDWEGRCVCDLRHWHGEGPGTLGIKARMSALVGSRSDKAPGSPLRTTVAYDVALRHLLEVIPDCRQ
jgi:hypothetical protein